MALFHAPGNQFLCPQQFEHEYSHAISHPGEKADVQIPKALIVEGIELISAELGTGLLYYIKQYKEFRPSQLPAITIVEISPECQNWTLHKMFL